MTTVSQAVAQKDEGPGAMVAQYSADFATVLPSHIRPETWVRLAQGVLRRDPKLAQAARSNPASLLTALLDAARQGLEPGSEQYYLVPRKRKGILEVQGIRGYQGEIELIYRAGAVSSVVVEVVREKDRFMFRPGIDPQPIHEPDWFGDRGQLVGVYGYCVMKDGATSKVVVLGKDHIDDAKKTSEGSDSEYSPWVKHEEAMWLKTAAHRLQKWVPTSNEYVRPAAEPNKPVTPPPAARQSDVLDGDVVTEAEDWPDVPVPGGAA